MPRIDINSPSPDEEFDITNDTIGSETYPPETETKTISDFSDVKPVVSPVTPAADAIVDQSKPEAVSTEPVTTSSPVVEAPIESTNGGERVSKPLGRLLLEALLVVLVVGLGGWAWSLKTDNNNLNKQVNNLGQQVTSLQSNPLLVAEKKQNEILAAVGRLTVLPSGEVPTISEVTDASAVKKSVPDLKDVQNGDKILFYLKSGQIIQYRPSTDKVVLNQRFTVNK